MTHCKIEAVEHGGIYMYYFTGKWIKSGSERECERVQCELECELNE